MQRPAKKDDPSKKNNEFPQEKSRQEQEEVEEEKCPNHHPPLLNKGTLMSKIMPQAQGNDRGYEEEQQIKMENPFQDLLKGGQNKDDSNELNPIKKEDNQERKMILSRSQIEGQFGEKLD